MLFRSVISGIVVRYASMLKSNDHKEREQEAYTDKLYEQQQFSVQYLD